MMIIYRDQGNSLAWVTWEIKGAKKCGAHEKGGQT